VIAAAALAFVLPNSARAQDKPVSFYGDIRPIFNANCNACHKPEKTKGDLDMTTHAALMKGGKHGSTVVPGDAAKSELLKMITGPEPEMPEDGDPLKPEQVSLIERWIKEGAKDDTPAAGTVKFEAPVYSAAPAISALAFSPDGQKLAVSGYHEVLLHKADGSALLSRLVGDAPRVEAIDFSDDGSRLAVCGGAPAEFGSVQVWNPADGQLVKAYKFSTDSLFGVSFSPDGKSLAFGGADKAVRRINVDDGAVLLEFRAHPDWTLATCFTLDGKKLVSGGRDMALKFIDLETQRFIDDINNPLEQVISMARHPGQDQVLYGGDQGTPRLYKISDNQGRTAGRNDTNLVRAFERQPGPASAVAFSPDGNAVAVGSVGEVRVYNANDGNRMATLSGHEGPVFAVAWSPDGNVIATGGFDGNVRLFEAKSGNLIKSFVPVPIEGAAAAK
jgi:WD40 repeat protein